jgi:transcriptional regulator with XRE-family HTH domain
MCRVASQTPSIVARRIQEIREAKRLSRQALADRIGTTYLKVYRIETGALDVSAAAAAEFASALDVSVASLYRESKAS